MSSWERFDAFFFDSPRAEKFMCRATVLWLFAAGLFVFACAVVLAVIAVSLLVGAVS